MCAPRPRGFSVVRKLWHSNFDVGISVYSDVCRRFGRRPAFGKHADLKISHVIGRAFIPMLAIANMCQVPATKPSNRDGMMSKRENQANILLQRKVVAECLKPEATS